MREKNKVRFGVVGIGYGRNVLLPALRKDPRVEVVAIAGRTAESSQQAANESGVPLAFAGWDKLLECNDIDALAIAVPPRTQPPIVAAAASRGMPVFLEKPIAATLGDAEEMAEHIKLRGLPNAVDFNFSALNAFTVARAKLVGGQIGKLQHAVVNWQVESYANRHRLESWKTDETSGGGTLQNFTSHCLHYLEWISGDRINGLFARLFRIPGDIRTGDATVSIHLELASHANAVVASSTAACRGTGHEISLYGSDGALILRNNGPDHMRGFDLFFAGRDDPMIRKVPLEEDTRGRDQDSRVVPTARLIERFVDWICGGTPVENDIMTGLRVQRLIEAARESNRRGCWIEVLPAPKV